MVSCDLRMQMYNRYLEVVPDLASSCMAEWPISREPGNALDWNGLMSLSDNGRIKPEGNCTSNMHEI